jgi:hypothetical protein
LEIDMTADSRQAPPRRPILSLANPPETPAAPARPILTLARPPAPKAPVAPAPVVKPAKPAAAVTKSLRPAPKANPPKPAKPTPVATQPVQPVPPVPKAKPPTAPKPAKVQRTPEEMAAILAAQAEQQRQAAITKQARVIEVENELRAAFPAAFPERHLPPVPLLIGIHKQLRVVMADRFSAVILGAFLEAWTRQSAYISALAEGVARHDLQGNPVGAPTEKEIALAKREMAKRCAVQKEEHV